MVYFRYQSLLLLKKTLVMNYKIQVADMDVKIEERG